MSNKRKTELKKEDAGNKNVESKPHYPARFAPPRNVSMFPDKGPMVDPPTPTSQFLNQEPARSPATPNHNYLEPKTIAEACIRASQEIDPNLRVAGGKDVAAMFIRLGELIAKVTK
jgi:hypothetical protein